MSDKLMDDLMKAASDSIHYCDRCSVMGCENFTEAVGYMVPIRLVGDLWLCDLCEPAAKAGAV